MTNLPPGIDPEDEINVTWEHTDDGIRVVASLGEASITVEASPDAIERLPWLAASLPQILEAAWAQIEQNLETDTEEDQ